MPFERYVFFNLITESGGGLEHKNSSVLMTSRWKARSEEGWRDWLSLVAHELFHAWNGKRLRPFALGPFDYEHEVYTPSLWFVEGVTSYYDDLLVHRAGLSTRRQYLDRLGKTIERCRRRRGASSSRSSPPRSTPGSSSTGRTRTRSTARSATTARAPWSAGCSTPASAAPATASAALDDLLRAAWQRWSGARGYTAGDLRALVGEIAGADTAAWLDAALTGTDELDYTAALDWYGLRLAEKDAEARSTPASDQPEPSKGAVALRHRRAHPRLARRRHRGPRRPARGHARSAAAPPPSRPASTSATRCWRSTTTGCRHKASTSG